jgi:hypothetical protein
LSTDESKRVLVTADVGRTLGFWWALIHQNRRHVPIR